VLKRLEVFKKTFARRCVRFSNRCIKYTAGSGGKRTCVQKGKRCSKYVLPSMLAKYQASKKKTSARKSKKGPTRKASKQDVPLSSWKKKTARKSEKPSRTLDKGKGPARKASEQDIPLSSWKKSKGQIKKQCVALLKLGGKTLSKATITSALAYIEARPNSSAGHARAKKCADRLIKSLGASLRVAVQPVRKRSRKQSTPKRAPWFHAPLQRWGAKGKRKTRDWKKKASPSKQKKKASPAKKRVTGEDLFGSDDEDDDFDYDDDFLVKDDGEFEGVPADLLNFYYKKYA
jgi:hypothetical protein